MDYRRKMAQAMTSRSPLLSFRENMADADTLLVYAEAFENGRSYRMRQELRESIGDAIRIPKRDRPKLDCLESRDLFVVFRDSARLGRDQFRDSRPLLRPVIVAACAAFETYLADKVMEFVGPLMRSGHIPARMKRILLSIGQWSEIEHDYKYRGWGIRNVVEAHVREQSSTAASKVGETLGIIGFGDWAKRVDSRRGVSKGRTVKELEHITKRRNQIAHSADRSGRGRAALERKQVAAYLSQIRSIVDAIDELLAEHTV